jgi:hypothetical protein
MYRTKDLAGVGTRRETKTSEVGGNEGLWKTHFYHSEILRRFKSSKSRLTSQKTKFRLSDNREETNHLSSQSIDDK